MTDLASYLTKLGDTEDWFEVVYQINRGIDTTIDQIQFDQFKERHGHITGAEIASFNLQQCKTLAHTICRILYWSEPPLFSINGELGVVEPSPFAFEEEVKALTDRTLHLLCPKSE